MRQGSSIIFGEKGGDGGERSERTKHSTSTYESQSIGIKRRSSLALSNLQEENSGCPFEFDVWLHKPGIEVRSGGERA